MWISARCGFFIFSFLLRCIRSTKTIDPTAALAAHHQCRVGQGQ